MLTVKKLDYRFVLGTVTTKNWQEHESTHPLLYFSDDVQKVSKFTVTFLHHEHLSDVFLFGL